MLDDFLVRALLAGIGLALVTGPAGCFVVWQRMAYFGETIAHSALLGVAIVILTDLNLTFGIFVTSSAVVLAMFWLEGRDTLPTDTLLGLLSHGGLALGLVLLSFFPNMRLDLQALLFGDILAVSRLDLACDLGGRNRCAGGAVVDLARAADCDCQPRHGRCGRFATEARPSGVRDSRSGDNCCCHQDRRGFADRCVADHTGSDSAALCIKPRENGRWRRSGRYCRGGRRAVRLGNAEHAVRSIHRRGCIGAVSGDPHTPSPNGRKRPLNQVTATMTS